MAHFEFSEIQLVVVSQVLKVSICTQDKTGFVGYKRNAIDERKQWDFRLVVPVTHEYLIRCLTHLTNQRVLLINYVQVLINTILSPTLRGMPTHENHITRQLIIKSPSKCFLHQLNLCLGIASLQPAHREFVKFE